MITTVNAAMIPAARRAVSHSRNSNRAVKHVAVRFIGAVVMLAGIGFLTVITASVTASLVESSRRRFAAQSDLDATQRLEDVSERLVRIEAALDQLVPGRSDDGVH